MFRYNSLSIQGTNEKFVLPYFQREKGLSFPHCKSLPALLVHAAQDTSLTETRIINPLGAIERPSLLMGNTAVIFLTLALFPHPGLISESIFGNECSRLVLSRLLSPNNPYHNQHAQMIDFIGSTQNYSVDSLTYSSMSNTDEASFNLTRPENIAIITARFVIPPTNGTENIPRSSNKQGMIITA